MAKDYEIIIKPKRGLIPFNVREIWEFRDLLALLVWRDIRVKYKQTVLGVAWAILQPLMAMVLFSVVFGKLAKVPSDGIAYPLFAYSGLLLWNYFSSTLTASASSFISNSSLVTKVYFPRLMIPVGASVSGMLDLFISSIFLIGMLFYFHVTPHFVLAIFLAPLLLAMTLMISVGCGLWLSALNVEYRDFQYVIPFLVQIWMFATPVIYPSSLLPEQYRWILYLNPMSGVIEAFRCTTLGNQTVNWISLAFSVIITMIILVSGLFYFRKVERSFADVI